MSIHSSLRDADRDFELEALERRRMKMVQKDMRSWREERKRELRKEIDEIERRSKKDGGRPKELDAGFWKKRGIGVVDRRAG